MGSPLGPLMANAFMCSVEEKLARENKLPSFYKRYVDDTLAPLRDLSDATDLLACHNEAHSSIQFAMEIATNDRLPFIGMEIIKIDGSLETCVYRKKTNKGLVLHYQSHVDSRYKRPLLRTKLDCLIYETLWIKNKGPELNTQTDSIRAKLFTWMLSCQFIFSLSKSINTPFRYYYLFVWQWWHEVVETSCYFTIVNFLA